MGRIRDVLTIPVVVVSPTTIAVAITDAAATAEAEVNSTIRVVEEVATVDAEVTAMWLWATLGSTVQEALLVAVMATIRWAEVEAAV